LCHGDHCTPNKKTPEEFLRESFDSPYVLPAAYISLVLKRAKRRNSIEPIVYSRRAVWAQDDAEELGLQKPNEFRARVLLNLIGVGI
jgi:hypothetical protein